MTYTGKTPLCIALARIGVRLTNAGTILGGSTLLLALLAHFLDAPIFETALLVLLASFIVTIILVLFTTIPALGLAAVTGYWKPTVEVLLEKEEA